MWQQGQLASYQGEIVIVDRVKRDCELESGGPNRPQHRHEIGIGAPGFPTGHDRLMTAQPVGQGGLSQSSPFSSFDDERSCIHDDHYSKSDMLEIAEQS